MDSIYERRMKIPCKTQSQRLVGWTLVKFCWAALEEENEINQQNVWDENAE